MNRQCTINTCTVMVEIPISWISHFRSFAIHFPADTVMCRCNNADLLLVLAAQIHKFSQSQKIYIYSIFISFIFQQTDLAFCGHADDGWGSSCWDNWLGFCALPLNPHLIACDLWTEFSLIQASPEGPAQWHESPSAHHSAGGTWMWQHSDNSDCFKMLWLPK